MAYDKSFWTKLAQESGVDLTKPLSEVLDNEGFVKTLGERALAKDDYSRNMDQLAQEKKRVTDYYNSLLKTTTDNQAVVDQVNAELARYRAAYPDLGTDPNAPKKVEVAPVDAITKAQFDQTVNQIPILLAESQRIAFDYFQKFGEPLPMDQVLKINSETGLPLAAAYDKFIAPKVAEKTAKDYEAKIAAAKAEGAAEYARTHQMPIDSKPADPHFLFDRPATDAELKTDHSRVTAFRDFFGSAEMAAAAAK